jgi:hypothetical protein
LELAGQIKNLKKWEAFLGMKRILFILVNKGLTSPVDNTTLMNLSKAMLLLQEGKCYMVYVALNHLEEEDILVASKCIMDIFNKEMSPELMAKFFVSHREGSYQEEFISYMSGFPFKEMCLQVLAIPHCRETISQEIDEFRFAATDRGMEVPLFLTPGSQHV